MESSTFLLILDLSHSFRQRLRQFMGGEAQWEPLARCAVEWSACRFIHRCNDCELSPEIKAIHDATICEYYYYLDQVPSNLRLKTADWKNDNTLWMHFWTGEEKHFPSWEDSVVVKEPVATDKGNEGLLLLSPLHSAYTYTEVTGMPRHAAVQALSTLSLGVHADKALQTAYDNTPVVPACFVQIKPHGNPHDFARHYHAWCADSVKGEPQPLVQPVKAPDAPTKGRGGKHENKAYAQRVNAGNREYRNPHKCANGERLHPSQVYARIHSKNPQWKDWYFIGSDKDPR